MSGLAARTRPIWSAAVFALVAGVGLLLPAAPAGPRGFELLGPWGPVLAGAALVFALWGRLIPASLLLPVGAVGAALPVLRLAQLDAPAAGGFWWLFWGFLMTMLTAVGRVSLQPRDLEEPLWVQRLRRTLPPLSVPIALLLLWQAPVVAFQVPKGIFPGVGAVIASLGESYPVLLSDSYVTFVKEVLLGFVLGLVGGFAAGVAIAGSSFLQRGFLPLAAAFGAVPIVGLAPVLGRAFGVDWESKAAVVVIVTFFPVVLNTVQGLTLVDPLKLELLKAYAARPRDVFLKLRVPNALPYLFNAMKLAAVLSVISVIVAEFLIPGPPEGLGQRISLSARRGAFDLVFAAIAVSSVISILFYGGLSALERWLTGWHPSFREDGA